MRSPIPAINSLMVSFTPLSFLTSSMLMALLRVAGLIRSIALV
jgi:hypothetical protein